MIPGELLLDASRLWAGEGWDDAPLAFVDLDAAPTVPGPIALPPFPVIGIGSRRHPLATLLDSVVEPPIGAAALARQVLRAPRAAAVAAQLLRLLPSLSVEHGLAAESMAYAALQGSEEHLRWRAARTPATVGPPGRVIVAREANRLSLTLDRPKGGNAIDRPMRDQLADALTLAALDRDIAMVEIHALGKAFCLGADLDEFGTTTDPATAHAIRVRTLPAWSAARCAGRIRVRVSGACIGAGLELAAWADRLTADRRAWFQLPELAMGLLPGAGGCVSLMRRIGRQRTALMILSGKRLNAGQALDWGLVDDIA